MARRLSVYPSSATRANSAAYPKTGLIFPSNGDAVGSGMFQFLGANVPSLSPATLIYRVNFRQHTGFYTVFFNGRGDGSFSGGFDYYGGHPYPQGTPGANGTVHNWELSAIGSDFIVDDNGNSTVVTKGRWYTVGFRVRDVGGTTSVLQIFYDLPDLTRVITKDLGGLLTPYGGTRALTFGDAPWNVGGERLSGTLRGLQIYSDWLGDSDLLTESANETVNAPQTLAGQSSVWFMNQNPRPDDINDKSGQGRNPAFVDSSRPTLYSV